MDEEFDDSDGMDDEEPETVTDKLRARIHEALGDGAALTDTVSHAILVKISTCLTFL